MRGNAESGTNDCSLYGWVSDDQPVFDPDRPVREGGDPRFVRDHDNGFLEFRIQTDKQFQNILGGILVEVPRRFVGDE